MKKQTYTDLCGNVVEVECLEWLEDGSYWDEDEGDYCACARYCINTDEDEDGESVWLNDNFKEVDTEAEPDEDDEDDDEGGAV